MTIKTSTTSTNSTRRSSSSSNGDAIVILVQKPSKATPSGLGLKRQAGTGAVVVSKINPDSLFRNTKLRVGMAIVSVNGVDCSLKPGSFVAQQLKSAGEGTLRLNVRNISALELMEAGVGLPPEETFPFVTAVLNKESKETKTGLAVTQKKTKDGKVYPMVGSIKPNSLASKTKLQQGMRILTINGVTCRTKDDTVAQLQNATGKVNIRAGNSRMIIVSAPKPAAGSKFGFKLGKKGNETVVVTNIDKGGLFEDTGLEVGMKVLKVNGKNISNMEMKAILGTISNCKKKVILLAESFPKPLANDSAVTNKPVVPDGPGIEAGGQWGTGDCHGANNSLLFCLLFPLCGCCCLYYCCKLDKKAMYLAPNGKVFDLEGRCIGNPSSVRFEPSPPGADHAPPEVPVSFAENLCGSGAVDSLFACGIFLFIIFWIFWVIMRLGVLGK